MIEETIDIVRSRLSFNGSDAIILGSGLGTFAKHLKKKLILPYSKIPGLPRSTVAGHHGELISGYHGERQVVVAKGRFHYYEGYDLSTVVLPVRIFNALGVRNLIITNSSGSITRSNPPGTLMAIKGHFDCTFRNGPDDPELRSNERYHDSSMLSIAKKVAKKIKINLAQGNYCWTLGPSYETAAEIDYFRQLGGNAVGMSTVPEVQEGAKLGMHILVLSVLTNYASGITMSELTHDEVLETANKTGKYFISLLLGIIAQLKPENGIKS
ncbi:MAG: purine-nucleoside phosphorylase [Candidatus Neomarinimicrobiota bacterium]|nr:purine-nucleoside phosphorylase [Candidatus Neomarinimicrobiota bacterium]